MNSQILACSSNETAKLARSTWVRCLLVVTCLWICALPVWLMRKKVHKLVLEFDAVPVQVFWERNYWIVRGAVAARGRRRIVAI